MKTKSKWDNLADEIKDIAMELVSEIEDLEDVRDEYLEEILKKDKIIEDLQNQLIELGNS